MPSAETVHYLVASAFFIVAGVLAILSYRQARRTLFQPLQVEVFKAQLAELRAVGEFFGRQSETELREHFAFPDLLKMNAQFMYDEYARSRFGVDADRETRLYGPKHCPGAVLRPGWARKHLTILVGDRQSQPALEDAAREARRADNEQPESWSDYEHGHIFLPAKYWTSEYTVASFLKSPLLPHVLAKAIQEFMTRVSENVRIIAEILTQGATEMPARYRTQADLEDGAYHWLHRRMVERLQPMVPHAEAITSLIRAHYGADGLSLRE